MLHKQAVLNAVQDGKVVTKGKIKTDAACESGSVLEIGYFVAEVDKPMDAEQFKWVVVHVGCCACFPELFYSKAV